MKAGVEASRLFRYNKKTDSVGRAVGKPVGIALNTPIIACETGENKVSGINAFFAH